MKKNFFLLAIMAVVSLFNYQTFAQQTEQNKEQNTTKQFVNPQKTDALGWDFGIGALENKSILYSGYGAPISLKYSTPVFAIGARYMHFFNPYIGADVLKVNFICPFRAEAEKDLMNFQFMTGIRGNTPTFLKSMSGYAAARMGYGFHFTDEFIHGIAFETEVGLNFNRIFFVAFSYNLMKVFNSGYLNFSGPDGYGMLPVYYSTTINLNTYALRFGFNF